jgi:2-polyprenyl-3-methyl-5-hydroxy-6-metoxy-1,4-benzoquinol methylase
MHHLLDFTQPDGALVVTTLNRSPVAGALAIGVAEHVLGIVPKGTHQYSKFLTPAELVTLLTGCGDSSTSVRVDAPLALHYDVLSRQWQFWDPRRSPSVLPARVAQGLFSLLGGGKQLPDWAVINYGVVAKKVASSVPRQQL